MSHSSAVRAHSHSLAPADVQSAISRALTHFAETEARRVEIEVRGPTVILEGVVASWAEHQAIVRAVMQMPGVAAVDDRLFRWEL